MEDSDIQSTGQSTNQTVNQTARSVERNCTQKLTIPILEKHDATGARQWWRRFTQYVKMTKDLDLTEMTTSREIKEQYRDRLEDEVKDIFIWALGQSAITEMTKTVREREPTTLPLWKLYSLFRLHFTPERNKYHSRADFFELKREPGESAADTWKRILEIEKNCEFEEITAAELLASKFLSVIGNNQNDKELKKKIKEGDMSIDNITEAIHEHIYRQQNLSDSEEETKIRYVQKNKRKIEEKERPKKFQSRECMRCGAPGWSKTHECPAKGKKCAKCGKIGHFAKKCRSDKSVNHIRDEAASSAEEDDWMPSNIHLIKQSINAMNPRRSDGQQFYTTTLLVNNRPIKFIIDSGSPVSLIPQQRFNNITPTRPVETEYKVVKNNRIKFVGKTKAEVECEGQKLELDLLITKKN